MLSALIDFSLRHRAMVIFASLAVVIAGSLAVRHMDIDAFPDTTPVQVQINTVVPSLGPEEVETQITFPIEQAISGLPKLQHLRSLSKFGMSQVVVIFEDGTDIYFARQLITERLGTIELSAGIERPKLGPVSTGLGEVFHYVVTGQGDDVTELRTIHDWVIRPAMRTVTGTAEVNTWGGFEKQFQIRLDPERLVKFGLTFDEVTAAVRGNNRNVGGGSITQPSGMLLVHGVARTVNLDEIKGIVIKAIDGVPLRIGDVGDVTIGHEIRRGAVTADGKGEVVLGLGFMLMGENSHEVTWSMKHKLDDIKKTLPANVNVTTVYDRTELVDFVIDTVRKNLFEGGLLVIAVLFAFLGNLRAAAIVALAIPLSMLCAFCGMLQYGIAASLLSLGAIDFGMVVDSSVVMVENCIRHIAHGDNKRRPLIDVIRDAAVEVRRPTMFGELIIMIVYTPILTLEGIEGKLFRPMALTVIFAAHRFDGVVADADARPRQPAAAEADRRTRTTADADRPRDSLPGAAILDAPQDGRDRVCRRGAGRDVRHDRSEPRQRVRATTLRRLVGFGAGPLAGDRSGRIGARQHGSRKDVVGKISGRGQSRLGPHWHGGSRDRSDGRRTDGSVYLAQAAIEVETGHDSG